MASMYSVFNQEELDILRNLPEVLATQGTAATYFKAPVPESIKQKLQTTIGLDLSQLKEVPFRWIYGDTKAHVDHGQRSFVNTYLIYLTDGEGQFEVGSETYPITSGTGFVFPSETRHAVTNTNKTKRLLLGPMSETGFPVGAATTIAVNGATDTVYVSQVDNTNYYRINNGSIVTLYLPAAIENTNEFPANNVLKVLFTTDITITNDYAYFYAISDGIQFGSETLKPDGSKYTITIDEITDFQGFIHPQTYSNIYVYNLYVKAINGSTLMTDNGWIGPYRYGNGGTNNYIIGCSSDGPIADDCGGIVGSESVSNNNSSLYIIGCSTSGTIGAGAGGIVGRTSGTNTGSLTIRYCSSSGTIGPGAGGIVGSYCGQTGECLVERCYSTGTIGVEAGGIFGPNAGAGGEGDSAARANFCYSRGNIAPDGGGIFGYSAASSSGTAIADQCYSSGVIGPSAGGIFGYDSDGTTINCYVADGGWSDSAAELNTNSSYISIEVNQPYELRNFGPSPYSLRTIINNNFSTSFNKIAVVGSGIGSVLSEFSSYSILKINGNAPSQTPTITINSTTGSVLTTTQTPPGVYTIVVRAIGSPYSITTLTVTLQQLTSLSLLSNSGAGTSMGNAQQGTRGLSAGDWTRIQRLRQSRTYATTLATNKDIIPTPFPQHSQEHLTSSLKVVGTSKIRRPASSWTDYTASQTGDFVISSLSSTTGTSVKNIVTRLCDCAPTTLLTKVGKCSKCDADYTLYPPLLCSQVSSPPPC